MSVSTLACSQSCRMAARSVQRASPMPRTFAMAPALEPDLQEQAVSGPAIPLNQRDGDRRAFGIEHDEAEVVVASPRQPRAGVDQPCNRIAHTCVLLPARVIVAHHHQCPHCVLCFDHDVSHWLRPIRTQSVAERAAGQCPPQLHSHDVRRGLKCLRALQPHLKPPQPERGRQQLERPEDIPRESALQGVSVKRAWS